MTQLKNSKKNKYYSYIENDARNILNVPQFIKNEDFIIEAININSFVVDFLTQDELNNKVIAFYIALNIKNHRKYISLLLEDKVFYKEYFKQKIINKSSDYYLNKQYINDKIFINEIINEIGYFHIKYLGESLIKDQRFIYYFLKADIKNENYLPKEMLEEAKKIDASPGNYYIKKIEYEMLNEQVVKSNFKSELKKI